MSRQQSLTMTETLIIPGLHNSGPTHWQSWFEERLPAARRVHQADWERPVLSVWAEQVRTAIDTSVGDVWLVAHSFGCLAAVTAGFDRPGRIRGALLVAPADPDRFGIAKVLLEERLEFPSILVASSNDPWVSASAAEYWAAQWDSKFINVGDLGHINVDSGHGPWPQGLGFFDRLRASR
ncbi:MAG TPA: alpha/beta hydrolase [Accumulibacter sp.]|uniref:RBBP9/YdeN family alpha/beta hydrolase n=2 Tax=Accumulibacter sp. TaxID=2053492 RepID=UPI002CEA1D57|nr:alpha/beta hydrolase [Accumulibacter sp.]HNL96361.1 alpha/beta hydrolase [Accumulibacter sp.]